MIAWALASRNHSLQRLDLKMIQGLWSTGNTRSKIESRGMDQLSISNFILRPIHFCKRKEVLTLVSLSLEEMSSKAGLPLNTQNCHQDNLAVFKVKPDLVAWDSIPLYTAKFIRFSQLMHLINQSHCTVGPSHHTLEDSAINFFALHSIFVFNMQ